MDLRNEEIQLVNRYSRKTRSIPLSQLIDMITLQLQNQASVDALTPRSENIQVLPIITSRQITLSFRPNSQGSIALEVDTEGVPVYLSFSKQEMKVTISCSYKNKKKVLKSILSNREILLPFSTEGAKSIEMEATYDGKDMFISADLK